MKWILFNVLLAFFMRNAVGFDTSKYINDAGEIIGDQFKEIKELALNKSSESTVSIDT